MKTSRSRPVSSIQQVSRSEQEMEEQPRASIRAGAKGDYHAGAPLELTDGPQLLIDDALVEDRWRLRREYLAPEKYIRNPLIARDQPWEGGLFPYFSVFFDESTRKFRLWYTSYTAEKHKIPGLGRTYVCYAESDNGFVWTKPLMSHVAAGEHKRTNIVYGGTHLDDDEGYGVVGTQVFRDEQERDESRRYKMITYEARPHKGGYRRGVNLAVSPDGFKWTLDGDEHILDYNSDCLNHVVHDPVRGRWLLYCRPRCTHATGRQPQDPAPPHYPAGRHSSRRVAVMTSTDFKTWSYPRTCFYPEENDATDYDAVTVFRHGSHFLMAYIAMAGDDAGTKEARLAWSSDGVRWQRYHDQTPWLARGREGDWDAGQLIRLSGNAPIERGNELFIYFGGATKGQYDWHGQGGIGLALMKTGRFVMQRADDEPGFLITKEFILRGNRLRLNTFYRKTKDIAHRLRVEVVYHPELGKHAGAKTRYEGFAMDDCDPLKENATDALVTWKGNADLSALVGKPVYLRFELQNMALFGFQITSE